MQAWLGIPSICMDIRSEGDLSDRACAGPSEMPRAMVQRSARTPARVRRSYFICSMSFQGESRVLREGGLEYESLDIQKKLQRIKGRTADVYARFSDIDPAARALTCTPSWTGAISPTGFATL